MKSSEALKDRTLRFALKIIELADLLPNKRSADILGRQIIRSATSIGANYRAACRSRSHAEFLSKIHDVQEEADETQYWLELLHKSNSVGEADYKTLSGESSELTAIFTASYATAKKNKDHPS
jgi:four helix bundle protein